MGGDAAVSFLGPEGVAQRHAEIQRRIESLAPRPAAPTPDFRASLDAAAGNVPLNPLTGEISPVKGPIGGDLRAMADDAAARHGLDPVLFRALVDQESSWDPNSTSKVGAQGLCQLMPDTARELGVSDSYDPAQSLDGGAHYLRRMLDASRGDTAQALAAYNAGFGRVNGRAMHEWPAETRAYVTRILARTSRGDA